ncbi:BRCT domain, Zinc finger, RING/FYVE/PHD-type [Artemisia annua]|uniref:BRCT domain, Zinc finger, RING/FYVE/PHD-type n=1 Tax=Artemisia annua TaxID=35608 RepID=A0A2U1LZP0_ARTAN|nr:BRCT domain, Zinc finger, RING/FYVE/PHD-type [Artemisia annua]
MDLSHQTSPFNRQSQQPLFAGIRFVLFGYDPITRAQVSRKLVSGGAVDAGIYSADCTHVIVNNIEYDDPVCVAARRDGKILVSGLWVDHSFDVGGPMLTDSVIYVPPRDLNGIPGAKSLVVCLTGYQREDREDIMVMVDLMGAKFTKPLKADTVTHLICYKFEGVTFFLKKWEILPEEDYSKSGHELEMEAEAKDSEDEAEGTTTRQNERKVASPHHSLLSKQEVPRSLSNTSAHRGFSNAENVVSATTKSSSDQFSNPYEIKSRHPGTGNVFGDATGPSNIFEGTASGSQTQNNIMAASRIASISPSNKARKVTLASYSREVPMRTPPPTIQTTSNTSSAKRLNKQNVIEALNMSKSLLEKVNDQNETTLAGVGAPHSYPAYCPEDEQNASSYGKRKMDVPSGSSKLQRISPDDDISIRESSHVESGQELRKNRQADTSYINTSAAKSPAKITPSKSIGRKSSGLKGKDVTADISYLNNSAATSPAKDIPFKTIGRKSPGFKGKNVIGDVAVSKTPTPEIVQDEDFDVVQRPQKDYRETSLVTKVDNTDIGVAVNVMQGLEKSSSAISSDLQKSSTPNLENNDEGAGTNSKSVKRKLLGKKFSAPSQSLDKKKTASQKGSIYLNSSQPKTDATTSTADENLSSSKVFKEVHPEAKSATEIVMEVGDDLMSGNKSLCMDDETEPPEDNEEGLNGEPANTVDIVMKEIAEADPVDVGQNNDKDGYSTERGNLISMENNVPVDKSGDTENLGSDKTSGRKKRLSTKKGKKKENVNKKAAQKKELANDNNNEKTEFTEEVTLDRAEKANNDVNELDAVNDHEHKIEEKKDDGTEMDADLVTENVVNKKETKKTKSPLSKAKTRNDLSVKEVARKKPVSKRRKPTSDGLAAAFDLEAQENMQKKTDDRTDKVADVNMENDVNKNVTKISKPTLRKTRKDAALSVEQETDTIADNQKIKPTSSRSVQARILEAQKKIQITAAAADDDFENRNDKKDDEVTEMDIDTDANKETKKNKRPLSKTKKDPALSVKEVTETKAVKKKGKTTSSRSVKARDMEAQKENMEIAEDDRSTDNKQVLKSATEGSEKVTRKSDKADSEPKWFILTGHSLQRREFQQLIRRLKGRVCKVSHQWSYQATHFIVPDPIKRTEKFFAAAASGRWILKTDYLTASSQAGKFLAEEPYEWHKNGLSEDGQINLEAPRKWRLLKEKTGYGAFHGMRIVIYGECIAPSLDTLKRAVKAGDGTILATSPPYTRFLNTGIDFAVVSPGMPHVDMWVQEFLSHEIPCIAADYLVEYVCKPGYPLDGHVQYDTNVWAERSYNNLKKRLDEEDNTGPRTPDSYDVACEVCGLHDRGEEMLICGDESGSIGCGVGTHIDCCDPPLDDIPDDDWFCPKCTKAMNSMTKKSNKRKGKMDSKLLEVFALVVIQIETFV